MTTKSEAEKWADEPRNFGCDGITSEARHNYGRADGRLEGIDKAIEWVDDLTWGAEHGEAPVSKEYLDGMEKVLRHLKQKRGK